MVFLDFKIFEIKDSPGLKAVSIQKTTKAGVTAKLNQLTKARLELLALQKDIAMKEHDFASEDHKFKMLALQNDEKRKQEMLKISVNKHLKSMLCYLKIE